MARASIPMVCHVKAIDELLARCTISRHAVRIAIS